jgi:hypothetical protein
MHINKRSRREAQVSSRREIEREGGGGGMIEGRNSEGKKGEL